jgi:hypothetical protein
VTILTRSLDVLAAAVQKASLWLAANPSKRWAEVFFLAYSPFWILWALCILVPFQLYEVGNTDLTHSVDAAAVQAPSQALQASYAGSFCRCRLCSRQQQQQQQQQPQPQQERL